MLSEHIYAFNQSLGFHVNQECIAGLRRSVQARPHLSDRTYRPRDVQSDRIGDEVICRAGFQIELRGRVGWSAASCR